MDEGGKLTLVATPIGNLGDLTPRAVQALTEADLWLVEDTRISGKLAAHLGLKKPMKLLTDLSTEGQLSGYLKAIQSGSRAVVITDGGSPCISDPGSRLTDLCTRSKIPIEVVPGVSAVTTALMASGFYAQRYAFLGFLRRKTGAIKSELLPYADSALTLVIFENLLRLENLLEGAHAALGDRRMVLCRELTKVHEQIYRGSLANCPSASEFPRKGELTLVIEGKRSSDSF